MIVRPRDGDDPQPRTWQIAGNGMVLGALLVVAVVNVWSLLS